MSASRSVLIVEDEPLIAMMLEDFLDALGHQVAGSVDSVEDALLQVEQGGFDVAILDVQLKDGRKVWPVVDRLTERGIPFIIATGGHIEPPPPEHAAAALLAKPYTIDAIEPALAQVFGD